MTISTRKGKFEFMEQIVITIVGFLLSLLSGLILFKLNSISRRLDRQDDRIDVLFANLADCKKDCDRNTVSKEDWVRSEGYTRQKIEQMTDAVMELNGKVKIIEQVPELVGKITREIVAHLKSGGFAND